MTRPAHWQSHVMTLLARWVVAAGVALALLSPAFAAGPTITGDVAYGPLPRQKLDIYTPPVVGENTPVLVFFYGGGWRRGARIEVRAVANAFARSGIIFVAPDYRLYPDAVFPQFVEDSALAVAYAWKHLRRADGSARPLFVAGHSAGAYNAAMVSIDQDFLIAAGAPRDAVTGFIGFSGAYGRIIFKGSGLEDIFPEATRDRSAVVDFVDAGDPPILLVTGDADTVVSVRHTRDLEKAATAAGVAVSTDIVSGYDHMGVYFALMEPHSAISERVAKFIAAHSRS